VSRVEKDDVKPIKEANLSGHLKNGNSEKDKGADKSGASDASESESLADKDYQLGEALNLLKGLAILGSRAAIKP
jgi:carboxyl-terminal processing protease